MRSSPSCTSVIVEMTNLGGGAMSPAEGDEVRSALCSGSTSRSTSPTLTPKQQQQQQTGLTVDELIALGGGFGRTQRAILAGAVAGYFVDATAIFLPIFLMPRLYSTIWSSLSLQEQRMTDALASSLFMLGNTCGLILGGIFGDHCGRRLSLLVGVAMTVIATVASLLFPPTVTSFLASRVIAGFGAGGALNSGFLLAVEWVPPSHRLFCKTCTSSMGWVPGILMLCVVAQMTRDAANPWQALLWCLSPAPFAWVYMYRQMHESPRFELTRGAPQAALRLLHKCAAANGKPLPFDAAIALPAVDGGAHKAAAGGTALSDGDDDKRLGGGGATVRPACKSMTPTKVVTPQPLALPPALSTTASNGSLAHSVVGSGGGDDGGGSAAGGATQSASVAASVGSACASSCGPGSLFHRSVRRRTLLVGGAWFGSTGVYYGVILAPLQLGHLSLEMRTALGALVELPVFLAMGPLGERFGRRRTWAGFLLTAGASLLMLGLLTGGSGAGASSHAALAAAASSSAKHAPHYAVVPGVHHANHYHVHHHHHHHHGNVTTWDTIGPAWTSRSASTARAEGEAAGETGEAGEAATAEPEQPDAGGAQPTTADEAPSSPHRYPRLVLFFVLLARCGAAGCACLVYVAAAEQFPTGCRNSAIGFGGACGRFASVLAPMAVHLLDAPFYTLAAVAVCAALAALALPETAGKPITEQTDEQRAD